MAFTSDRPITVDGVRLDTLAWNLRTVSKATASRRTRDLTLVGVDGVTPSLGDPLEPATLGLAMFVRGTDADGAVPGVGARTAMQNNLDELIHLFGKRHALLDVRQVVDGSGTERRTWAKVVDSIAPDLNEAGSAGEFTVGLSLPYGVWEDPATQDWTSGQIAAGVAQEVLTLRGATERNQEAIVLVQGPANNPRITDTGSGEWVQWNGSLAAADYWRVNLRTWASRVGPGLTLASADTAGTEAGATTTYGGGQARSAYLNLTPYRSGANRVTSLALSAGSGITAATRLSVRARRKFAL